MTEDMKVTIIDAELGEIDILDESDVEEALEDLPTESE